VKALAPVLAVIGIVLIIVGAINHWAMHANPVAHTSTILGVIGAVVLIVGGALMFMGRRAAA
jgi:hypothetical protein